MAQAASLPPLTEETQIQSQDSLCGKYVGQNGTGERLFLMLWYFPVKIILLLGHVRLHLFLILIRTRGNRQGTFGKKR